MAAPALDSISALPDRGDLRETPLARLLLDLDRRAAQGTLEIEAPGAPLRITVRAGRVVAVEGGEAPELGEFLVRRGEISEAQHGEARRVAGTRGCPEASALVGLAHISPKALLIAMQARLREALMACLALESGRYALGPAAAGEPGADALRADSIEAVHAALVARWRPDRMLADLQDRLHLHPVPGARFAAVATRLAPAPGAGPLLDALDGKCDAWSLLQSATATEKIAALWVLDASAALDWRDGAQVPEELAEAPAEPTPEGPEIEIVVSGARSAAAGPAAGAARPKPKAKGAQGEEVSAAMRAEILERHAALEELDLYGVLAVERSASLGQIKRAYLQAAKRLHPDALARLALDDIKAQCNAVFARITKAHETLCDPDGRRNYDAVLDGHGEGDANQLAQAEALFIKGEVMMKAGQFNSAVDYLEASVELWPQECAYQSAFGWTLFKKAPPEDEQARVHLQKAIEIDPGDAQAHFRLSVVLKSLGEVDAAAHHASRAREIDPAVHA